MTSGSKMMHHGQESSQQYVHSMSGPVAVIDTALTAPTYGHTAVRKINSTKSDQGTNPSSGPAAIFLWSIKRDSRDDI